MDKYHQYSLGVGKFFNLDMYDEEIRNQYDDRILERRIDVLRRLEFSTRPATDVVLDPKFKEMVRFSQMTSSLGCDERSFDLFYNGLIGKCSKAFRDDLVDFNELCEGYRALSDKIAGNARGLASQYKRDRKTERFVPAVWSGNLTRELIELFDRF